MLDSSIRPPSDRGLFLTIYTPTGAQRRDCRQIIEEEIAFPLKQSTEDLQRFIDAFLDHDASNCLPRSGAQARARRRPQRPDAPWRRFEVVEGEATNRRQLLSTPEGLRLLADLKLVQKRYQEENNLCLAADRLEEEQGRA